ncbi:MAG: twin-arginine translocase subunit TatC [Alphaproteobacteria bacterium]
MSDTDPQDQALIEASRAPLIEHLIELRGRLMKIMFAVFIAFIGCYFFAEHIYAFLVQPYANVVGEDSGKRLIFTALHETFFTYIKVAFWGAICISFPVIAWQIYAFVAPGLYRHERMAFLPFLMATPVLFIAGASLVYYGVMPLAIEFFLGFESSGGDTGLAIELEAKVGEYLALVMKLIFAFGLAFQLPVVLTLLARVGIITSAWLREKRKYAVIAVFGAAAVLTPPDPISQVGLALPILILYEVSIWLAKMIEKRADENAIAPGE